MTEIVGFDGFGAPLLAHQVTGRTMYECPGCGAEFSSPFGAVACEEDHAAEDRRLGRSSD